MKRDASGPCLSAVFVDYDNIYLSLKRRDEEAAKRFARDAGVWIREIESGGLITPTNQHAGQFNRRIVMNRCYGNPVPRRNGRDGATDMSSFPFVRHHFLRGGFEVVDCPPLTAQLKNSSDIRIVMDVRDYLTHETYFDEFILLSGDSDFTPLLHRLRAHARRTVIYANEYTASPYTAICDGEVREQDLIRLLLDGSLDVEAPSTRPERADIEAQRRLILAEVVGVIESSDRPVPIETLADRAQRALGHDKTIGTGWAGFGSFRNFLAETLPEHIDLTEQAPYHAYDRKRHALPSEAPARPALDVPPAAERAAAPVVAWPEPAAPVRTAAASVAEPPVRTPPARPPIDLQAAIARIHDACQAPPLAPPEYRTLFEAMAAEISENGLSGAQTITSIAGRAAKAGLTVKRDDVRFVLDVVSEADPWFEQGASANLFAGRFRNFAVARCRGQGISLSAEELDLIDAWFASGPVGPQMLQRHAPTPALPPSPPENELHADDHWKTEERKTRAPEPPAASHDDLGQIDPMHMPRIVRTR